jgi:hypothetical protein
MKMPEFETAVLVTMPNGDEFQAMRIMMDEWHCWATLEEDEPLQPECWTDGVCWEENENLQKSIDPVSWRPISF